MAQQTGKPTRCSRISRTANGAIHQTGYDSFGNQTSQVTEPGAAAVDCLFGYTGRPFDSNTGLQNNLDRWYDPSVGKWLSEDPSGLAPDSNPYRYCGNGPTDGTDPSGMAEPPSQLPPGLELPPDFPSYPGMTGTDAPVLEWYRTHLVPAPAPYVGPQTSNTGLKIAQLMDLVNGSDDSKALLAQAKTECGKVTPWFEPAFGRGNASSEPVGAPTTLNGKGVWIAKGSILLDPNVADLSQAMDMLIFEIANMSQANKIADLQMRVKAQGMSEDEYQVQSLVIESESNDIAARILKNNAVTWKIKVSRGPCPGYAQAVNKGSQVAWAQARYKWLINNDPLHVRSTKAAWQQLIDQYNQTHPNK